MYGRRRSSSSWGGGYFTYRPKVDKSKYLKSHQDLKPVSIEGRTIAKTFWGKRWLDHFEGMADFDNRLPRGRTYARNGSILDLDIQKGQIEAVVAGSDFYNIVVKVTPLSESRFADIKGRCAGLISTVLDLLKGQLSPKVLETLCHPQDGMFPRRNEITYTCSCPDCAILCKHVAAVLYGVGHRLDTNPELLFLLRGVEPSDLFSEASVEALLGQADSEDALEGDLGAIFGIEVDDADEPTPKAPKTRALKTVAKVEAAPEPQPAKTAKRPMKTPEPQPTLTAKRSVKTPEPQPTMAAKRPMKAPEPQPTKALTAEPLERADAPPAKNGSPLEIALSRLVALSAAIEEKKSQSGPAQNPQASLREETSQPSKAGKTNRPGNGHGSKAIGSSKAKATLAPELQALVKRSDFNLSGDNVRDLRLFAGLSVEELSSNVRVVPGTIKRWEDCGPNIIGFHSGTWTRLKRWMDTLL
ncbi:MAG: SWIM zinc finger family protein [Deltaproteobacteria bacterium]|jgi:uncharacterized Zn finger protein|nr:SWIM zinc finger family protein [Deltaproteobacteria bacterium]